MPAQFFACEGNRSTRSHCTGSTMHLHLIWARTNLSGGKADRSVSFPKTPSTWIRAMRQSQQRSTSAEANRLGPTLTPHCQPRVVMQAIAGCSSRVRF
jgi:hypothetical protein